jgi:hypothetical protein
MAMMSMHMVDAISLHIIIFCKRNFQRKIDYYIDPLSFINFTLRKLFPQVPFILFHVLICALSI